MLIATYEGVCVGFEHIMMLVGVAAVITALVGGESKILSVTVVGHLSDGVRISLGLFGALCIGFGAFIGFIFQDDGTEETRTSGVQSTDISASTDPPSSSADAPTESEPTIASTERPTATDALSEPSEETDGDVTDEPRPTATEPPPSSDPELESQLASNEFEWRSEAGELLATSVSLTGHSDAVTTVEFAGDGSTVLTASFDHTARLWSAADGSQLALFEHDDAVNAAIMTRGQEAILTGSSDGVMKRWDGSSYALLSESEFERNIYAFDFSAPYLVSALAGARPNLAGEDAESSYNLGDGSSQAFSVDFSPSGAEVATGSVDGSARVYSTTDGSEIANYASGGGVAKVAYAPDGEHLVTAASDGQVNLLDLATGEVVMSAFEPGQSGASLSADMQLLATGGDDGTLRIWDVATGAVAIELYVCPEGGPIADVAFSPVDDRVVVAAAACGENVSHIFTLE